MTPNTYDGQSPPHGLQSSGMTSVLDRNSLRDTVADALLFVLPVRIAVLDRQGRIVAVNEAWKQYLNGPSPLSALAHADVGADFLSACHADLAVSDGKIPQVEASIRAAVDGRQSEFSVEYRIGPPAGRQWFLLQIHSLPSPVPGALVIHLDITDRKQTVKAWADSLTSDRVTRAELARGGRTADSVRSDIPPQGAQSPLVFRLHVLEALTDTALSRLPTADLIGELLERATAVMAVDNAAILLLEPDGETLTLRAARGPEEELIGSAKVQVGKGFAGRIAASRQPVVLDDISRSHVVTPLLREKLRSLAGVPLLVEDRLIGVLHIGSSTARHFTEEDVHLLLLVADRIGPALERARLYTAEQEARARAEGALARATESERRASQRAEELQTIVETMADGIAVVDRTGRITHTNHAFRELLALDRIHGYENLQVAERAHLLQVRDAAGAFMPPEQLAISRALQGEVVKGPGADLLVHSGDGHEREITTSAAPLKDLDGKIVGAVAVVRDISWRKRLERERELALANEMSLKATTQRLDEFLATAAHDLRAPLAVATTAIDLTASRLERLASTSDDDGADFERRLEPIRDCLEQASQSVDRLSRMVTMLFDTAQLRSGTLELHRSTCDLSRVVRDQVDALSKANRQRIIDVETPAGQPVYITVDVDRISQVVTNFITNAIKYSADEEHIGVRVTLEDALARVSVRDHGPGLPTIEQERIWERFYRVPGIRVQGRQSSGLGLGLHICKTIVERHGGQVGVESAQNSGSTFWFTVPVSVSDM